MALGVAFFIVAFMIAAIWIIIEFKRIRHKVFALFLIALILFTYLSFTSVLSGQNLDMTTTNGWIKAGGLYLSWLSGLFTKVKSITLYAVGLDWKGNETNSTQVNS